MANPVSAIDKKTVLDAALLRQQDLFRDVDITPVLPILQGCDTRQLQKGETLVRAGDTNHYLYLILAGSFRVYLPVDMQNPIVTLHEGQSIGEISIFDRQPASVHVIADTDSHVVILAEDVLWAILKACKAVAYNLLLVMAQRLHNSNSVMKQIKELLSKYEHNATIDSLTGLYNRRWLDDMLARVMHRCQTDGQNLSVLMIDFDYFKQYNDTHGHIAGDAALRIISRSVLQKLRPEDLVARYGGEELFALLPGLDLDAAEAVAERLRQEVSTTAITTRDHQTLPSLTISVGLATLQANDKPDDLIRAADNALYRAKHAGRNRVSR